MIDFEFAKSQIGRIAGLKDYPRYHPEAEAELVRVAMRLATSETHLENTIDEISEVWLNCPKPAELRAMLQRERQELVNPSCPDCAGSGWKTVEKKGASGALRCACGSVPRDPGVVLVDTKRESSTGLLGVGKSKFLIEAVSDPAEEERLQKAEEEGLREIERELERQAEQRKPRTKAEIEAMLYPRVEPEKPITQDDIDAAEIRPVKPMKRQASH